MADTQDAAETRLTLRLSLDLDRGMRESAAFVGRSVGAEWRTAATVYRRVLSVWSETARSQLERGGGERQDLLVDLCEGIVEPPRSIKHLRANLQPAREKR